MERDHWTFGAGYLHVCPALRYFLLTVHFASRRICPGTSVAERILFLAISRLFWAFTVHEIPEEPISLEEYEGTAGRTPVPYRVRMIPRHEGVRVALEAEQEISRSKS